MKILTQVLCILFGVLFINAGLDKFFHYMPMPTMTAEVEKIYAAFGTLSWLMPLVAIIEILGGLLFMIPKTRPLGALVILPVMIGIVVHNATFMPEGLVIAGILLVINLFVIAQNWKKYQTLIA